MGGLSRLRWWQWVPVPGRKWRVVLRVAAADEVPHRLPPGGVVLVGSPDRPKWLAFDCPCGLGHRIMANLDVARSPRWSVTQAHPLTLTPSIDAVTAGRRCHFLLKNGRVAWVRNTHSRR